MALVTLATAMDYSLGRTGIGETVAKTLAPLQKHYAKGEVIRHQGDEVLHMYCVKNGWITDNCVLENGTRRILNFYVPLDIIGLEYLGRATSTCNLVAMTDCETFLFSIADFKKGVMESELASLGLVSLLSRRMADHQRDMSVSAVGSASARLAHFLIQMKGKLETHEGSQMDTLRTPFTQQDIGDYLGLTNVTVSRELTKLQSLGLIRYKVGEIAILDLIALQQLYLNMTESWDGGG